MMDIQYLGNQELLKLQKTAFLASDIKSFFEKSKDAIEVLVFKGNKTISIKRGLVQNSAFNRLFRKLYEK